MRVITVLLILLGCAPARAFQKPAPDTRPFGKYLIRVCTVTVSSVTCTPLSNTGSDSAPVTPAPPSPEKRTQTITLKLACAPGTTSCKPAYPLVAPADFYVSADNDSGLGLDLRVVSGNAAQVPALPPPPPPPPLPRPPLLRHYRVTAPGTVVIEATGESNAEFVPPVPVELVLSVLDKSPSTPSDSTCMGLFPASPDAPPVASIQPRVELSDIVALLGIPTPFTLTAVGSDQIFVYSSRYPIAGDEIAFARSLPELIASLAQQTKTALGVAPPAPKAFQVELTIPHAAALGDLASLIKGLNYQFTVQDIGNDKVRIGAPSQPDCPTWTAFLSSVRHLEWEPVPEPFMKQLFYLTANDLVTAFTSPGGGSSTPTPAPTTTPPASTTAPAPGASTSAGNATVAVTQPPGSVLEIHSDTTPCVFAGLTMSNSSACAPASGSGASPSGSSPSASTAPSSSGSAPAATSKPPSMENVPMTAPGQQTISDLLVFSDATPGDDATITERKRVLALLDLPRPEMIVNAWVMQNSSTDPRAMGNFSGAVRDLVANYNEAVERLILRAWNFVEGETRQPGYFEPQFYSYIADRYIADTHPASPATKPDAAAQQFLDTSPAVLADNPEQLQNDFGICNRHRYCLGYNALFHPLKPRLTDVVLTLIAADRPIPETDNTIKDVEGQSNPVTAERVCESVDPQGLAKQRPDLTKQQQLDLARRQRERCRAIWNNLDLGLDYGCITKDYQRILGSVIEPTPPAGYTSPRIYLACFKEKADLYLMKPGVARAAIADFLFNYKMSQQYPHEFVPYDLSQSADALNVTLSPLIDAFNRDIVAFQTFMRADVQYQIERLNNSHDQRCCAKRLFGLDKPAFFNDGLVTVRTISGQPTSAMTTSQSYLDSSTAPTLANLANNIASGGSATTGTSPIAGVLGSKAQPAASLVTGVLNSYQTSYAQIGRALNLTVTPRSLATASAAEMTITLNADDSGPTPAYTGGPTGSQPPNTSHVASHDVTTRVRVESVKLFELSSFSAVLDRSRSKFPLLPPFVELPYIGTFAGIPIPGAREYHASTAVISAMVVPTAADIAYGLKFTMDQVLDAGAGSCSYLKNSAGDPKMNPCAFRRAIALSDLNRKPVRSFHRFMINCLATNGSSPYSSLASTQAGVPNACRDLTFDKVPLDAY